MVFSITFELKSDPSTRERKVNTLWAKSSDDPTMDKVKNLLARLYGDDVDKKSIKLAQGGEEWDEKEMQKGARLYDLDQE